MNTFFEAALQQCSTPLLITNSDGDILFRNSAANGFINAAHENIANAIENDEAFFIALKTARRSTVNTPLRITTISGEKLSAKLSRINQQQTPLFLLQWPSNKEANIFTHLNQQLSTLKSDQRQLQQARIANQKVISKLERQSQQMIDALHMVNHDLREPVRQIASYAEFSLLPNSKEEQQQNLEFIKQGAARLQTLLDGLMGYSRVLGRQPEHIAVNLSPILETLLKQAQRQTSFQYHIADNIPAVVGDPTLLQQLYQNLISNAIKYRDQTRPLVLNIYTRDKNSHTIQNNQVEIVVEDNGIGVSPKKRKDVFTLFRRLVPAKRGIDGTGAGLAICAKIVEYCDGDIYCEPAAEHGSRFVTLLNVA